MKARTEKNPCYNFDEVYAPGHGCKNRQMIITMTEEEELGCQEEGDEIEAIDELEENEDMTISVNAMIGNISLNTLKNQWQGIWGGTAITY